MQKTNYQIERIGMASRLTSATVRHLVYVSALLLAWSATAGAEIFRNPLNGHYYEHVAAGGLSWAGARALAEQRSHLGLPGHLATLTSQAEWDFIRAQVYTSQQDTIFIGGNDAAVEGEWRWVTGPEGQADGGQGLLFWLGAASGSVQSGLFAQWKENGTAFQSSGTFSTANCDYLTMYSYYTPTFSCTVANTTGWTTGAGGASGYLVEYSLRPQEISFGTPPSIGVGETGTASATGGASGNPIVFTTLTESTCSVSGANGSSVTGIAAGTCTIAANQDGNDTYSAAPQRTLSFTVEQSDATILRNPSNGHYYEHVAAGGLSWVDAQALAEQRNHLGIPGHLATVTSQGEWDFIRTQVYTSQQATVFIGGNDAAVEGEWRWVTGPEGQADGGQGLLFWLGAASGSVQNGLFAQWKENGTAFQSSGTFSTANCDYLTMYSYYTPTFSCTVANTTGLNPTAGGASGYLVEYSLWSQEISFGTPPSIGVGEAGTALASGGASGNPVTFSSQTTGVCTVSGTNGSTVTGLAVGNCTIAANQAGNTTYAAANEVTQTFAIGQGSQTISFGPAPTVVVDGTGMVSATGGASGNPVVFSSQTTGVCTVNGTTVTGVTVGTCRIAANQPESANYAAANEVTQSFSIGEGSQTIMFAPLANKLDDAPPFIVSAIGGNSSQAVTFASQTESVCTTSGSNGSMVTLSGQLGTCTVRASQAGDANYNAAMPVDQSFEVTASNQPPTIDLPATYSMLEDGSGSVWFTVGDDLTPAADLTVVATSSNIGLISDESLATGLGGSGANRTLAFSLVGNENGSAVITVTVIDGNGVSEQAQLTLTVTPVNDPPSAAYGQNEVWPAGETGEKTAAGFVSLTSAGPGNESGQIVSIDLAIDSDPDGVLSAASIQPNGDLTYTLTGNSGAARITLQAVDDGGIVNGGVDRGEVVTRRIIVGEGIDLTLSIRRGQPQSKHLGDALAKGATMAAYSIEVRNNSAQDANGLRLQVSPIIGLTDTLWNCVISSCSPPNGSGGIDTVVDLQAGGVLLVGLSGTVDTDVPFVEITARASLPHGVTVLLQDDDDQVFIEPSGGTGVYKSGFE